MDHNDRVIELGQQAGIQSYIGSQESIEDLQTHERQLKEKRDLQQRDREEIERARRIK